MLAAKDGDTCGPEDSDPCAGSSYKVSSSAASAGAPAVLTACLQQASAPALLWGTGKMKLQECGSEMVLFAFQFAAPFKTSQLRCFELISISIS